MRYEIMHHIRCRLIRILPPRGLLLFGLALLLLFGLTGCQSSPTITPVSPSVTESVALEPAGPITEESPQPAVATERIQLAIPFASSVWPENFYAGRGYSGRVGVYYDGKAGFFLAQMPPGDYVLTYTTTLGQFYIVFRAAANALLRIGLMSGDVVYEAMLYQGTVTDTSYTDHYDPVIVYSEFDARDGWWNIFSRDDSAGIMLIGAIGVTYKEGESLTLVFHRPACYVVDYRTNLGGYRVEFQTTSLQEQRVIPLQPGEVILEAYVTVYE